LNQFCWNLITTWRFILFQIFKNHFHLFKILWESASRSPISFFTQLQNTDKQNTKPRAFYVLIIKIINNNVQIIQHLTVNVATSCSPLHDGCNTQTNLDLRNTTSNIEILERFQSKALRMIVDALWYVRNTIIRKDLQIPTVKEEIRRYSFQYSVRFSAHPNDLIVNFNGLPDNRRFRRHLPNDLPIKFLV
jgi:hypothetical protein